MSPLKLRRNLKFHVLSHWSCFPIPTLSFVHRPLLVFRSNFILPLAAIPFPRTNPRRLPSRPVRCPSPSQWRAPATEDPSCAQTQDRRKSSNSASSVTTSHSPERCCPAGIPAFVPCAFVSRFYCGQTHPGK